MIFLIEYDRNRGEIVTLKEFKDSEQQMADDSRLELELRLNRFGTTHEVVILEANSQDALRLTHRRYFESLSELVNSPV